MWDVIIVGAGAAGLTAGMYTARRALSTLILSRDLGGQAALTDWIENYPGIVGKTHGLKIMENFRKQYEEFGGTLRFEEVKRIERKPPLGPVGSILKIEPEISGLRRPQIYGSDYKSEPTGMGKSPQDEECFRVITAIGEEQARAVILAFGLTPRELKVLGEERLKGKGVTYCATCDGPLFKGKTVGVVGATGAALDAAEFLSRICEKVYAFPQRDKFLGTAILIDKVEKRENIEVLYNRKIVEILGENKVEGVKWHDIKTQEIGETQLDGVFIEIGYIAKTDWVKDFIELDAKRQIRVDKENKTSVPGVYAAGDVTDVDYKQVVISAGEGAKAALEVYKYLQAKAGKPAVLIPDWGGR